MKGNRRQLRRTRFWSIAYNSRFYAVLFHTRAGAWDYWYANNLSAPEWEIVRVEVVEVRRKRPMPRRRIHGDPK